MLALKITKPLSELVRISLMVNKFMHVIGLGLDMEAFEIQFKLTSTYFSRK